MDSSEIWGCWVDSNVRIPLLKDVRVTFEPVIVDVQACEGEDIPIYSQRNQSPGQPFGDQYRFKSMSVRVRAANEGKDTYIENPRRKWTCSVLLDGLDSLLLIIDSGGCRRELLKGVKLK